MVIDATGEFEARRGMLFGLAYRLLGSAADAEDVVQDAFLRWHGADHGAIAAPGAWLARVVTNLCLNRLASARAQRERYVGPWLPEPVMTADGELGPMDTAQQRDSVSMALLALMEKLSPPERAAFVLRESFGYRHREIAEVLGVSEENSRQLCRRARGRIDRSAGSRFEPATVPWQQLVERFLAAAQDGDLPGLEQFLADDVTAWADGGGKVSAARRAVSGRAVVAHYLAGVIRTFGSGIEVMLAEVNGQPGVLGRRGTELVGVLAVEIAGDRIAALRIVANPGKLGFAARQADRLSQNRPLAGS
jgi:RNA polymerase sigma-70 factor (ECF subfamily)